MWSEGGWGKPNCSVAYALAGSQLGTLKQIGEVLQQDLKIAAGAGRLQL